MPHRHFADRPLASTAAPSAPVSATGDHEIHTPQAIPIHMGGGARKVEDGAPIRETAYRFTTA